MTIKIEDVDLREYKFLENGRWLWIQTMVGEEMYARIPASFSFEKRREVDFLYLHNVFMRSVVRGEDGKAAVSINPRFVERGVAEPYMIRVEHIVLMGDVVAVLGKELENSWREFIGEKRLVTGGMDFETAKRKMLENK